MKDHIEDPGILIRNQDTDAMKWAEAFCHRFPSVDVPSACSWFANAMCTQMDRTHNMHVKPLQEKREKLLELLLLTDPVVENVVIGKFQLVQHQEFLRAFPDELEMLNCRPEYVDSLPQIPRSVID